MHYSGRRLRAGRAAAPFSRRGRRSSPRKSGRREEAFRLDLEIDELKRRNSELLRLITREKGKRDAFANAFDDVGEEASTTEPAPLDIIYVSAEVAPWSKTGGLGDVSQSLPSALAEDSGHNITVVSPLYASVKDQWCREDSESEDRAADESGEGEGLDSSLHLRCVCENMVLDMNLSGLQQVKLYGTRWKNVDWIFVDHPCYERAGGPYGDANGAFLDNPFRFSLLALASIELPLQWWSSLEKRRDLRSDPILFMANDWHASMVPVYLASKFRKNGVFEFSRCLFCIHNLMHQGAFSPLLYPMLGLEEDQRHLFDFQDNNVVFDCPDVAPKRGPSHLSSLYQYNAETADEDEAAGTEEGALAGAERCINMMVAGIRTSDRIVTVSSTYAWEILSSRGFGFSFGLSGELKKRRSEIHGVVNGIDVEEWDPTCDPSIPFHFGSEDMSGKERCKIDLLKELGLGDGPESGEILIGFIGRLDTQKGADVLLDALPSMLESHGVHIVMLGTGDEKLEQRIRSAEHSFPGTFRGVLEFDVPLAHKIMAASDMLVMPSRFEPCGLNQLFAMRYGTVPLVHRVGGLFDTVQDFNPVTGTGNGWGFEPCTPAALLQTLALALQVFKSKAQWERIVRTCMRRDSGWRGDPASQYAMLMKWTMQEQPHLKTSAMRRRTGV